MRIETMLSIGPGHTSTRCHQSLGVIAAFREQFVKPGRIDVQYNDIYGRVMDHRHVGDYEVGLSIEERQAHADVYDAERFVRYINEWLEREGHL